jgi:C-terminal processing protease CtpA/Prc
MVERRLAALAALALATAGVPALAGESIPPVPVRAGASPAGQAAEPSPEDEAKRKEQEAKLKAEIAKLIKQLADEQWNVRDAAQKRLAEIGMAAVPALKEAAQSKDLEVATRARALLRKLIGQGWLGVEIHDPDADERRIRELPDHGGVMVGRALENTPAAKAGLAPGDMVYAIDGKKLNDSAHMIETVSKIEPGTKVKLTIYRAAKKQEVEVTVARRPKEYCQDGDGDGADDPPAPDIELPIE